MYYSQDKSQCTIWKSYSSSKFIVKRSEIKKKTHAAERCRIDLLTFDGFDAQTKKFLYMLHFNNFYFRRQSPSQAAAAAMLEISMFFSFLSLPPLYPHHCTVDQYKWDHCYLFHIKWSLMFWLRNYFTHTYMWYMGIY